MSETGSPRFARMVPRSGEVPTPLGWRLRGGTTASPYARRRPRPPHTSHPRPMQNPTDPADRTGTIGRRGELLGDGGAFVVHRPTAADRPRRVAFVDGTLHTEARLTRTGLDGDVNMGLGGKLGGGGGARRWRRTGPLRLGGDGGAPPSSLAGGASGRRVRRRNGAPASPARDCRGGHRPPGDAVRHRSRRRGRKRPSGPQAGCSGFASALHRDARAPVNLTPIRGLQGDARLALRAGE